MPQTLYQPEPLSKNEKVPTNAELQGQNKELLAQNAALLEQVHQLREEVQALRDEVARLKKQKPKPTIRPSKLNEKEKQRQKRRKAKKKRPRQFDEIKVVKAENVPEGSRFKGYDDFFVQELVIKSVTTRFRKEKWLTPEGDLIIAELKNESNMPHFGPTLCSFVLYQYYHAQVTEPLILEQLREWGVQISSGQLHRLITEGKEKFHQEKDEILRVGLKLSSHVHADDTGARHQGKNGYCTHIGNQWFAWFESTDSKSRINFLDLLRAGGTDYVLSGEALEYMAAQKLPKEQIDKLSCEEERSFPDKATWQAFLKHRGITADRHVRIATEGALLGAVLRSEINPELVIVSDDAGQFNVLLHALCPQRSVRLIGLCSPKVIDFSNRKI
jgi:regulator of replication initiation timing